MGSSAKLCKFKMTLNQGDPRVVFCAGETVADIEIVNEDEIQ